MARKTQIIIAWLVFSGVLLLVGLTTSVFENRLLNIAYEAGTILIGSVAIIYLFAVINTAIAKSAPDFHKRCPVWILLILMLGVAVAARARMDDYIRSHAQAQQTSSHP